MNDYKDRHNQRSTGEVAAPEAITHDQAFERAAVVKYLRGNAESHWNGGVGRIISAMADAIEKGEHTK